MNVDVIKYELLGDQVNDSFKIETIDIPEAIWLNATSLKKFIRTRYFKGTWLKSISLDGDDNFVYVDVKGTPALELRKEDMS